MVDTTKVTTDDVVDRLSEARELIADPRHWTSRAAARDAAGLPTFPVSDDAVCWCAMGALVRATDRRTMGYHPLFERCRLVLYAASIELRPEAPTGIVVINDWYGHMSVLSVYDRAIELAIERAAA